MRVAIVGSGISGIAAAWTLRGVCRPTVYEASPTPGGHSNTVDITLKGQDFSVDTGFIVFNDRTYPGFVRFLRDLEVQTRPTAMSFSVRHDGDDLEYNGNGPRALFAQRRNLFRPGFWRLLRDIARLGRDCKEWLRTPGHELTLGEFLDHRGYSNELARWYLVPMVAAIWSSSDRASLEMPFELFCRFFENHAFFDLGDRPVWRTVVGGSRSYVSRALACIDADLRVSSPVLAVRRPGGRASGAVEVVTARGVEAFDFAILACHSDTSLAILDPATPLERNLLECFPYERNTATLHTDERVMPRRRAAWAAWNSWIPAGDRRRDEPAMLSYHMNTLQSLETPSGMPLIVSLNALSRVDSDRVLRTIEYHHPRFTPDGFAAQHRFGELPESGPVFFAGAYWRHGFHEDGFWSGVRAAELVLRAQARAACSRVPLRSGTL